MFLSRNTDKLVLPVIFVNLFDFSLMSDFTGTKTTAKIALQKTDLVLPPDDQITVSAPLPDDLQIDHHTPQLGDLMTGPAPQLEDLLINHAHPQDGLLRGIIPDMTADKPDGHLDGSLLGGTHLVAD